jgi:hemoglobin
MTARAICPPAAADLFIAKAEMIGQSLQLGIAASRGEFLPLLPEPRPLSGGA